MCEESSEDDLIAYEHQSMRVRLRIAWSLGRFVPKNSAGYVQRFGYRPTPEGTEYVVWKRGHWERWVPPD